MDEQNLNMENYDDLLMDESQFLNYEPTETDNTEQPEGVQDVNKEDNNSTSTDEVADKQSDVPEFTKEELSAIREKLFTDRQTQMAQIEQNHQNRLRELAAQEQAMIARQMAMNQQVAQPELNEFDKAVNAAVDQRLQSVMTPQMAQMRQQMAAQMQAQAIQNTFQAGVSDPSMPNFDQISGLAINAFGRDVIMNKVMSSNPKDAARWVYNLGLAEAKAVPITNVNNQTPAPATQLQKAQPQLPRGMQVKGGSSAMSDQDWSTLDNKISSMSLEQITEFKKNPRNLELFNRMLNTGTTNPKVSAPRRGGF